MLMLAGMDGACPLEKSFQTVDPDKLYSQLFALGMSNANSIMNVNAAIQIRDRIRQGTASLIPDENNACVQHLHLQKALYVEHQLVSQSGTFVVHLNQEYTKCSCMTARNLGRIREQQKNLCAHKVPLHACMACMHACVPVVA